MCQVMFVFVFGVVVHTIYSGVPLMDVNRLVFVDMDLANPKSHNLTVPFALMRIFCGFISL